MHDGEDEEEKEEVLEAGRGVGKLVDSNDSDSCDLSERGMRMLFLRPVPRRGATGTAADGERFFEADKETVQLKSPILARQSSTDIISDLASQVEKQSSATHPAIIFEAVITIATAHEFSSLP